MKKTSIKNNKTKKNKFQITKPKRILKITKTISLANTINANNKLEEIKKKLTLDKKLNLSKTIKKDVVLFNFAQEKPYFKNCKNFKNENEKSKCFKEQILKN